jgi:flavin reductase (DIM6/NTAB) family NADH-FMN oxidoreductase RutF
MTSVLPLRPVAAHPTGHRALRSALGRYATGVAIVTTTDASGAPYGLTVNSFTSVSLDPPLVLWCLQRRAASLDAFRGSYGFAVHVLARDQRELAERFAQPAMDKFADVEWTPDERGRPILDGVVGRFDCRRHEILDGGDHVIVLGEIERYVTTPGAVLLFHDGGFATHPTRPRV